MAKLGFYFDMRACIGCRACQIACNDKNRIENAGILYREVQTFEAGKYPNAGMFHLSMSCNHCENPACVDKCPTGAMYIAEDSTVQHNDAICIGCQACVSACPYGHPKYFENMQLVGKCDSCRSLREAGKKPACVDACIMRCLDFGPLDELIQKYGSDLVTEMHCMPESNTNPAFLVKAKSFGLMEDPKKKDL